MKENIFSNFYTKVMSFFTANKEEGESARDTASNRLKLVLMQDRSNLDGATMQKMREQLITVISKYIEIDTEALDLNLEGDGEEIALMLNIPVIRARTPEEIAEIEAAEEAKKEQAEEESQESESEDEKTEEETLESESEENENEEEDSETEAEAEKEDEQQQVNEEENDSKESVECEIEKEEEENEPQNQKTKKQKKSKNN